MCRIASISDPILDGTKRPSCVRIDTWQRAKVVGKGLSFAERGARAARQLAILQ